MLTVAILFDHIPAYLRCDAAPSKEPSILSLPLGPRTVLAAFVERLTRFGADEIFVIPTFEAGDDYRHRMKSIAPARVEICPLSRQRELIENYEGGDIIAAFDARYWPRSPWVISELLSTCVTERTAVQGVSSLGGATDFSSSDQSTERVVLDEAGQIKRIRRLYDKIAWSPRAGWGVCGVIAPQQSVDTGPLYPIGKTRERMLTEGMASRDYPIKGPVFDLSDPGEALRLNQDVVAAEVKKHTVCAGYVRHGSETLLGESCQLSPSARVVGPVILKSHSRVDAGATLLGPCVIGHGARVRRDALVAQSVLLDNGELAENAKLVRAFGLGESNGQCPGDPEAPGESVHQGLLASRWPQKIELDPEPGAPSPPQLQGTGTYLAVKRAVDVVASLIGILLLLPVLPFIILLIKRDSPGPVFFTAKREGLNGRDFPCLKLRTMRVGADKQQRALYERNEVDGPQFNVENDPRITRVGRWLRRCNIDELPQLLNVLLGHMSLVGPRPSPFRENQICLPWRAARLSVRPGITGVWQLCRRHREESDFNQWIYYDIAYVRHFGFWLDMKILFYTATTLGGRRRVRLEQLIRERKRGRESF